MISGVVGRKRGVAGQARIEEAGDTIFFGVSHSLNATESSSDWRIKKTVFLGLDFSVSYATGSWLNRHSLVYF